MGNLNEFFRDLGRNAYGLGENVASFGSAAIAEPVAGFAAMYDPANGAQAIREGMTYTPRTQAGKMYQQGAARTLGEMVKPAIPVIETWQRGVDIAGGYSPMAGAALRTVPAAIGVAMGAKPALQAGRQVSNSLGAMQARMVANANAPRTLNAGYMGQRGAIGTQRPLTEFEQAHATAQRNAALPLSAGGLGLPADNTAMDRARAMGFDIDNPVYHGTNVDIEAFDPINHNKGKTRGAGSFLTDNPLNAETYINGSGGGNILPVVVNKKGFLETNAKGQNWNDIDFEKLRTGRKKTSELLGQGDVRGEFTSTDELSMLAGDAGLKGIILNNIKDTGPNSHIFRAKEYIKNKYGFEPSPDWKNVTSKQFTEARDFVEKQYKTNKSQVTAVNDPSTIRSRFAAFDPMQRQSSNLLAQSAKLAPAATLGALMANEKRKEKRN